MLEEVDGVCTSGMTLAVSDGACAFGMALAVSDGVCTSGVAFAVPVSTSSVYLVSPAFSVVKIPEASKVKADETPCSVKKTWKGSTRPSSHRAIVKCVFCSLTVSVYLVVAWAKAFPASSSAASRRSDACTVHDSMVCSALLLRWINRRIGFLWFRGFFFFRECL